MSYVLARPRLAALTQLAGDLIGVGCVVNVIDCPVDSKKKSPGTSPGPSNQFPGDVLLSHEVYLEVPSGLEGSNFEIASFRALNILWSSLTAD